jgi:hypothetical protein
MHWKEFNQRLSDGELQACINEVETKIESTADRKTRALYRLQRMQFSWEKRRREGDGDAATDLGEAGMPLSGLYAVWRKVRVTSESPAPVFRNDA